MNTIKQTSIIKCLTRDKARQAVKTLRAAGKNASLIDNGKQYTGINRWAVQIVREILVAPRKPLGNTFANMEKETLTQCNTGRKNTYAYNSDIARCKAVAVYTKSNYSRKSNLHIVC